jgi:YegS/Rv2252/BmrU family lipid kinase
MEIRPHPEFGDEDVLAILSHSSLDDLPFFKRELPRVLPGVKVVSPGDLEDLGRIVRRSHTKFRLLLAVGGDGTLHQVLQHLDTDQQVLGLLPAGTGNDVARTIGYPRRLRERIARLAELQAQATDFGTAAGRRFINSAGIGLDAETLRTREQKKGFFHRNYTAAFLLTLNKLKPIAATISIDGEEQSGEYHWVLMMNTPYIGGGTPIAPDASMDDGKLDALVVRKLGKFRLLTLMPAALSGRHLRVQGTEYQQVRSLKVTAEKPVDYVALDGELVLWAQRELEFTVRSGQLKMLR